jgi:hypothetical protein
MESSTANGPSHLALLHPYRAATRPEGYGIFSAVLGFPMAGAWKVEVFVRRSGRPELGVPFALSVQ